MRNYHNSSFILAGELLPHINLACLSVCLYSINVKTAEPIGPKFFVGHLGTKISNICLHQNSIFIKFLKILKIHEIFCENPQTIFVLFYDVQKENMFTINLEDGREARFIRLVYI